LCAAVPNRSGRSIGFVGAVVIWEVIRWSVPFGGVPLATLAMSQVDSPLAPTVRLLGPLLLVALTAMAGVGLANLWTVWRRRPTIVTQADWLRLAVPIVIVLGAPVLASLAPSGHVVGSLDVALVQGGGEQGTRALNTSTEEVFRRHLEASTLVEGPVDLVVWPENAIDTNDRLEQTPKWEILTAWQPNLTPSLWLVSPRTFPILPSSTPPLQFLPRVNPLTVTRKKSVCLSVNSFPFVR